MTTESAKSKSKTKTVSIRLTIEKIDTLERIALSKNKALATYLRDLVDNNIELEMNEAVNDDHIIIDIALGLATLLQISGQQDDLVRKEIQQKAAPILMKLNKAFKVNEGAIQ